MADDVVCLESTISLNLLQAKVGRRRRVGTGWSDRWSVRWSEKIVLTDNQKKIIEIMKKNPNVSRKELVKKVGINASAIQKHIAKLKDAGWIKRIGPNFGGHWEVLEKGR